MAAPNTFSSLIQVITSVGLEALALDLRNAGIRSVCDVRASGPRVPENIQPSAWHTILRAAGCGVSLDKLTVKRDEPVPTRRIASYQPNFAGVVEWLSDNRIADSADNFRAIGIKRPADLLERRDSVLANTPTVHRHVLRRLLDDDCGDTPKSTPRSDFPTIRTTSRGCIQSALEAALPHHRDAALEDIESCKYANSSRNARDVQWRTWCRLADAWQLPPIPITTKLVDCIAASLRRGGYRSAVNYFARARDEHLLQLGTPVSHLVSHAIRQAIRAVDRGALAQSPKEAFELEAFAGPANSYSVFTNNGQGSPSTPTPDSTVNGYPTSKTFAVRFTVLGCWWLTREIEIAAATIGDVEVRHSDKTVRWRLPASKSDQAGRGVVRSHGCACKADQSHGDTSLSYSFHKICPYHQMCAHLSDLGDLGQSTPLFPSNKGQFLSKESSVGLIRSAVTEIFGEAEEAARIDRLGGHSLRVSGAQAMARTGIDTTLIQLIGRWGSSTVLRYIQDAPLERSHLIASIFAKSCTSANINEDRAQAPLAITANETLLDDTIPHATEVALLTPPDTLPSSSERPSAAQFAPGDDFVQNPRTGLIHRSRGPLIGDCNSWSLRCGWNFLRSGPGYSILGKQLPAGSRCPRCFRATPTATLDAASGSDSETSDSSS
jgi:hypothetical protein